MSGPQVDHEKFPNPSGSDKTFPVKGSAGYKEANPLPEDNPDIKAMERMGVGVTPDNKTNEESKPNNVGVSAFNLGSRSAAMIDEDVAVAIPELSDPRPLDLNPNKIQPVQETKNILRVN
ncbi:hypothetical protein G9A89_000153 [Geosiphon pyriformis]|nr:hypothetical protein G9A89_000153 [Geosiphon pyriformis]